MKIYWSIEVHLPPCESQVHNLKATDSNPVHTTNFINALALKSLGRSALLKAYGEQVRFEIGAKSVFLNVECVC